MKFDWKLLQTMNEKVPPPYGMTGVVIENNVVLRGCPTPFHCIKRPSCKDGCEAVGYIVPESERIAPSIHKPR